jgi:hypothetical protein
MLTLSLVGDAVNPTAKGPTLNSPSAMSAATSEDVAGALVRLLLLVPSSPCTSRDPTDTDSLLRPLLTQASPNSAMRGIIYIYANNKHKWEKRWFVLDNDLLFYYKNASVQPTNLLTCGGQQ